MVAARFICWVLLPFLVANFNILCIFATIDKLLRHKKEAVIFHSLFCL